MIWSKLIWELRRISSFMAFSQVFHSSAPSFATIFAKPSKDCPARPFEAFSFMGNYFDHPHFYRWYFRKSGYQDNPRFR